MLKQGVVTTVASMFLALGSSAAFAADRPVAVGEARVQRVNAADLDLRKPADRKVLERRVGWEVMAVCPFPNGSSMSDMTQFATCRRKALSASQPHVAMLVDKASGTGRQAVLAQADIR